MDGGIIKHGRGGSTRQIAVCKYVSHARYVLEILREGGHRFYFGVGISGARRHGLVSYGG